VKTVPVQRQPLATASWIQRNVQLHVVCILVVMNVVLSADSHGQTESRTYQKALVIEPCLGIYQTFTKLNDRRIASHRRLSDSFVTTADLSQSSSRILWCSNYIRQPGRHTERLAPMQSRHVNSCSNQPVRITCLRSVFIPLHLAIDSVYSRFYDYVHV